MVTTSKTHCLTFGIYFFKWYKSDQYAAPFWDTHSLTEFEDDLELAREKVFVKPEKQVMTIRVDKKSVNAMKAIAKEKRGLIPNPDDYCCYKEAVFCRGEQKCYGT
jgi:hypothetical protein